MTPTKFPQANTVFGPPEDLAESQCMKIHAFLGNVHGGSVDGSPIVVVAWLPTHEELNALNMGQPIFLSVLGGLPPHFLATSFEQAINPS